MSLYVMGVATLVIHLWLWQCAIRYQFLILVISFELFTVPSFVSLSIFAYVFSLPVATFPRFRPFILVLFYYFSYFIFTIILFLRIRIFVHIVVIYFLPLHPFFKIFCSYLLFLLHCVPPSSVLISYRANIPILYRSFLSYFFHSNNIS